MCAASVSQLVSSRGCVCMCVSLGGGVGQNERVSGLAGPCESVCLCVFYLALWSHMSECRDGCVTETQRHRQRN